MPREKPELATPVLGSIGVAWYRKGDWPRIKSHFSDAADLHDTYEEWRQDCEAAIRDVTAQGHLVVPVTIDTMTSSDGAWCAAASATQKLPRSM